MTSNGFHSPFLRDPINEYHFTPRFPRHSPSYKNAFFKIAPTFIINICKKLTGNKILQ